MPEQLDDATLDVVRRWARQAGRAVIFDFNGTLSDDEPILEKIFAEVFEEHLGWRMSAADYRRTLLGHSDREIVEIAVREHGTGDPGIVEEILTQRGHRYRRAVAERSPITPAAAALVDRLAAAAVPMAIVTGAQRADVEAVLASSPVGEHIKVLITDEDVAQGKPDPAGFLRGAETLGVRPQDVLVFEDSAPGIRGARAAGMACIAVTGPSPNPDVLDLASVVVTALGVELLATTPI